MHFSTSLKDVRLSSVTMSRRGVITSLAVSPPKRIIPFNMLLSSLISFLSVSSKACDNSSTEILCTFGSKYLLRNEVEFTNREANGWNNFSKNKRPGAENLQKLRVFCAASIFGSISPKSNSKNVRMTVIITNSAKGDKNSNTFMKK